MAAEGMEAARQGWGWVSHKGYGEGRWWWAGDMDEWGGRVWAQGAKSQGPERALPEASGLKVHATSCRFDGSSIDKQSLEEKG